MPLAEAVRLAPTCLVLSHAHQVQINERENRRLAPADAVVIEHQAPGAPTTNAPQTMRVWPGLRLVGAGGKVAKGTFMRVAETDAERVAPAHTRLCHAITYASCQGLTLRGRVWLLDAGTQHFNLRHLHVGASRATSSELLSVQKGVVGGFRMIWGNLGAKNASISLPTAKKRAAFRSPTPSSEGG